VAFYGHKNFIIIFNNLGKHIAASEANPELSKVFPQFSFAFCPNPPPAPLYHLAYTHAGHFRLYICPDFSGGTAKYGRTRIRTVEHSSRSQSANAVNHGAGKQATEQQRPARKTGRK